MVVFTFRMLHLLQLEMHNLVSTLTEMQSKLDCIMHIVSCVSADSMPANPDLPDDIVLPVTNLHNLEYPSTGT